jgi:hypothetical protein
MPSRNSRQGEVSLPLGYRLDRSDPEVLILRSPEGAAVARFSASGYSPKSIEQEAWEDHERRNGRGPLRIPPR